MKKQLCALTLSLLAPLLVASPVCAQMSPQMKEGITAYKQGQYKTAVTALMGALNTEFNNAKLHYYLGNSFVHLKQNDSAIREFRIAYALEPDQEVGRFSKAALINLGVDTNPGAPTPPAPPPKPVRRPDPIIAEALESLRKQASAARDYENHANEFLNHEAAQRAQRELERAKSDMQKNNVSWKRGRGYVQNDRLPADSQRTLDNMRSNFENQTNSRKQNSNYRVNELQRTADNLEELIKEKNPKSGVKVKPVGTNLYIRNYENPSGR